MNEKLFNIINDPNVQFFIVSTSKLRELIIEGEHPSVKKMVTTAKEALLDPNKVIPISKEDIYNFLVDRNKLDIDSLFLLENSDIRVIGTPSINVNKLKEGN